MRLKVNPKPASGFCAGSNSGIVNAGVNGIFPSANFPMIVREAEAESVSDENLANTLKFVNNGLLFSIDCVKVPETNNHRSVDQVLSGLFSRFFKTDFTFEKTPKFTLTELNAGFGLATPKSTPDFVHTTILKGSDLRIGLAVIEFKDTAHAPLEQMGQAFVNGCNVILSHIGLGLKWYQCAVPLVLTNGNLYQFAWVTLLEPSFPVLNVTTGVLDASVPYTGNQIAENLARIKMFCASAEERIRLCSSEFTSMSVIELDLTKYYRKLFKNTFLRWEDTEQSLGYLWDIYKHLADVEEAVLTLGFAKLIEESSAASDEFIIFPMLEKEFAMGVPGDKDLYDQYLAKLKKAIENIHQSGVIHIDLYPSNILWRVHEGTMIIRIVDWDAATLTGDSFTDKMETRLKLPENSAYYWKSKGVAEAKCDYWFLFILTHLTDNERNSLNGEEPSTVNDAYKRIVNRQRADDESLNSTFERWYNSQSNTLA